MPTLVVRVNQALGEAALTAAVIGFYRHTGNFLLGAPDDEVPDALRVVGDQLDRRCAIISVSDLNDLLSRVPLAGAAPEPFTRWTPGLALLAHGMASTELIRSTPIADLSVLSASAVAVRKRDFLTADGVLDRARRSGGWGAIASTIESQAGGLWTARSLSAVRGILERAAAA